MSYIENGRPEIHNSTRTSRYHVNHEEGGPNNVYQEDFEEKKRPSSVGNNIAESVLAVLAYIFLILGILVSIGYGFIFGKGPLSSPVMGFFIFLGGTIISLVIWASLMISVNISNNIRQIKKELQKRNQ